jgi:hypothetical protein
LNRQLVLGAPFLILSERQILSYRQERQGRCGELLGDASESDQSPPAGRPRARVSGWVRTVPQRLDGATRVIRLKSTRSCLPEGIDLQLAAASRAFQHIQPKIAARSRVVKSSRAQVALKSLPYNTKKFFKEFT